MNNLNDFFDKPLYPNSPTFDNTEKPNGSPFFSQFKENPNLQSILPLFLGMKNGDMTDLSKLLQKNSGHNPLFQIFSSMNENKNKKESQRSPKKILKDEIF